jgi:hypothetical protein
MNLTKEQKEFLDRVVPTGEWTLNSEGKVDVDYGSVYLNMEGLYKIPLKFGKVDGSFYCYNNNLTSLEGCPDYVGGIFDCSENNLTSLEGCPDEVGGSFNCFNNPLKNYFKNIKEEDFKHWSKLTWRWVLEYPFLINITKNYVGKEGFIYYIEKCPKTKLYLK